jgi:hypothetical protein
MGIEEFNFASAVLSGQNFAGLASLVAGLVQEKDATNVGLTYLEMQDLIKSFGMETCVNLGRPASASEAGVLDASFQLFWALPLSEVQKFNVPVVIGSDIVSEIAIPKDTRLGAGDDHFIEALAHGYVDISVNKTFTTSARIVNDLSSALGAGYEFPYGAELNAIDWFDLSAVVKAKNIRFDQRGNSTDISAIYSLFHEVDQYNTNVAPGECSRSGDRLNDVSNAKIIGGNNGAYDTKANADLSFNERDRDYLNFLNLFVPTPSFKDVSHCGIATIAPYLEAGLFKSAVGAGKEYFNKATELKAQIRNNVRGSNKDEGSNLTNEFLIMRDYGFNKQKTKEAYTNELTFGVNKGVTAISRYAPTAPELGSPEDIADQFEVVFGQTGTLSDQLSQYGALDTWNDPTGGVKLTALKDATNVTGWVDYINQVEDYITSDSDNYWSDKGLVNPTNSKSATSLIKKWGQFQEVLAVDPRLSHLPNIINDPEQDKRLRILLETIANADASSNMATVDKDLSFSSWTQNDMTLGIHNDLSDSATYIKDGEFFSAKTGGKHNTKSIWAAAVKHGWSDATEVYGNLKGSGLFMMDKQYNVRSRVRKLDRLEDSNNGVTTTVTNAFKGVTGKRLLNNTETDLFLGKSGSNRFVYEYFTPGHFQDAFFDLTDLQHTANVAMRYFDLSNVSTTADDVSRNITNVNGVVDYRLPLATMDMAQNQVPGNYSDTKQHARIAWVYNRLVKGTLKNTRAAIAEMTSWNPVPPTLYVDVSDVTGFEEPAKRVEAAKKAGDFDYSDADGAYENRSLPKGMVHVMANYFSKAAADSANAGSGNNNDIHDLITLLDMHPTETLRAFNRMASGIDKTQGNFGQTAIHGSSKFTSSADVDAMIGVMIQALVHYGKPASQLTAIGASAKVAVKAFKDEVKNWVTNENNDNDEVFGDTTDVFSMVQHLGYWVPYLSLYSPEEIADAIADDSEILNIGKLARALMLGILLAITRGTIASSKPEDAAARIAGVNALVNAKVAKQLLEFAYTFRGFNVSTNLAGSLYAQ